MPQCASFCNLSPTDSREVPKKTVCVWAASLILSGFVVIGILFFFGMPRVFHTFVPLSENRHLDSVNGTAATTLEPNPEGHKRSDGPRFQAQTQNIRQVVAAVSARVIQRKKGTGKDEDKGVSSSMMIAHMLARALFLYHSQFGNYPENGRIEEALRGDNPGRIELLRPSAFLDSWKRRYELTITENGYLHVRSSGPDGIMGNTDDRFYDINISGGR